MADAFCDDFAAALANAMRGDVAAPVSLFGETLEQESLHAGSFRDVPGCPDGVPGRAWEELVSREVGHEHHRLHGGAQYHRALREFNLAARRLSDPDVSEDEIANAAGTGDSHDGINFLPASCVIALEKARDSFDPLLDALDDRICHVMSRTNEAAIPMPAGWRESFGRTVTTKYNCFFLTPFLEDFRRFLREELTKVYEKYEGRLGDVFDLTAATMMQRRRQREFLESSLFSLATTDKTTTRRADEGLRGARGTAWRRIRSDGRHHDAAPSGAKK